MAIKRAARVVFGVACLGATFLMPWAAVSLLLLGSLGYALCGFRPPFLPRWSFVVVAWLVALALVPALPNWIPRASRHVDDDEWWRSVFLCFYPLVILGAGTAAAWFAGPGAPTRRRHLPLMFAATTLIAWIVLSPEGLAIRAFHVLFEIAVSVLIRFEDAPPPRYDDFIIRPRIGLYLSSAAIMAWLGYVLFKLGASYRADRRRIREHEAQLLAELDSPHKP